MQRRAVAIAVVFFLVVGAGAYALIGVSEAPTVSFSGEAYAADDSLSVADRTYTVDSVSDGSAELVWTNRSARFTETIDNDTTVSPLSVTWDGQQARWSRTLADGSTFPYNDSTYRVAVNASADPPTATLSDAEDPSINETIAVEDELPYRNNETTVTAIDGSGVTLTWSEPYRVVVPNATASDTVTFHQQFDVEGRLARDPGVYDETVTVGGVRSVVLRADNTTVSLEQYLPAPDVATFGEGEQLTVDDNVMTIANVSADGIRLERTGERTETVRLSNAATVTLNGESHFVYFPDSSSVQLLPPEAAQSYQEQLDEIDYYHERMNGLRGVGLLSAIAIIMLFTMAYLPVKG